MPQVPFARSALTAVLVAVCADTAYAQTARIAGVVRDESNQPVKAATITAENPDASPSTVTAATDEKGRFAIIGLAPGSWTFKAQAPGFSLESGTMTVRAAGAANPPMTIVLKKGPGASPPPVMSGKDLQSELTNADQAFNSQDWDEAIARYQALLAKAPALQVINLQIGNCYRNKKDYDKAIAAYSKVLEADPNNDKAKIGIGLASLERGDLKTAEDTLATAAGSPAATKDVFYNLAEVEFAKGESDEAAKWYQKASEADPSWGRPVYKLALVALNKGDREGAAKLLEKVLAIDPASLEAGQARVALEQLKR